MKEYFANPSINKLKDVSKELAKYFKENTELDVSSSWNNICFWPPKSKKEPLLKLGDKSWIKESLFWNSNAGLCIKQGYKSI